MKAAVVAFATLLMLSGDHVTMYLAGNPVSVPVPVLILAAELAACAVVVSLICRALRGTSIALPRRTA